MLVDKPVDKDVDTMTKEQLPPISFRLNLQELEILKNYKEDDESINQCAARLLRERIGIPNVDSKSTGLEPLLELMILDILETQVQAIQRRVDNNVDIALGRLTERIQALENRDTPTKTTRTYTKKPKENS